MTIQGRVHRVPKGNRQNAPIIAQFLNDSAKSLIVKNAKLLKTLLFSLPKTFPMKPE